MSARPTIRAASCAAAGRRLALAAAALAALAVAGCGGRTSASSRPSIVLVSIDTLRADRLGSYGHAADTSPALDGLRRDAVLFREAFAQAPSTLPSHASLFTGLVPQRHRASHTDARPLAPEATTLAELLRDQGYRTLAVTGGGQVSAALGLGQGFESYVEISERGSVPGMFGRAARRAVAALDALDRGPFFLFLHSYEVHHPYMPLPALLRSLDPDYRGGLPDAISIPLLRRINSGGQRLDAAGLRHVSRAYEAEIRSMDAGLRWLLRRLRERGLYEGSAIVFTSDHGEELGEHGFVGWHGHSLYDELLQVPLVVKLPGNRYAGREVPWAVRSVDVAPTLLALAGIAPPPGLDGRDLLPLVAGEEREDRPAVAWRERLPEAAPECSGLRTPSWKLHCGRLFDLRQDPGERRDLAARRPDVVRSMERRLAVETTRGAALEPRRVTVDEELSRQLRALGYLDGR